MKLILLALKIIDQYVECKNSLIRRVFNIRPKLIDRDQAIELARNSLKERFEKERFMMPDNYDTPSISDGIKYWKLFFSNGIPFIHTTAAQPSTRLCLALQISM